jgi:hypothetical protein
LNFTPMLAAQVAQQSLAAARIVDHLHAKAMDDFPQPVGDRVVHHSKPPGDGWTSEPIGQG